MIEFLLAASLVWLATRERSKKAPTLVMDVDEGTKEYVVSLIRLECSRQGLRPDYALAFAEVESGFNPRQRGDLNWATRAGGALYRVRVLENPRLANNPARTDPSAWHSYGVFQLLAAYHVAPHEHPSVLYDAQTNVQRGVQAIRGLLERAQGDVYAARLAYVGCGFGGDKCEPQRVNEIRTRLSQALSHWASPSTPGAKP